MGSSIEDDLWKEVDKQHDWAWRIKEAERVAGLNLEKAVADTTELGGEVVDTIGLGMRRKLWSISYFFDGYEDVYERIQNEDKRMELNLINLLIGDNRKFIFKIVETYIEEVFKGREEREVNRILGLIFKVSSKSAVGNSIKFGASYAIAEAIYLSIIKNTALKSIVGRYANIFLSAFQVYGFYEKASAAANRLKIQCPQLYLSLYFKKLEMLYFIVESELEKGIYLIDGFNKKYVSDDEVARVISDMIGNL
ncbi:hypothetical protein FE392_05850 [Xenorhabdus sp. 12]|uniref:Uncharacterized protein n=1 Tax=Xenorhabdus santafensis TaxID=2582833 RepID=A0ABU4S7U1_9GAMM|nr:hypothetical protein [Xenorhabdus sp. 12]MDX7986856.1 hypothetical protein [Xenorhabdus sp. 12]